MKKTMSVGAVILIASRDETIVIEHAAAFARQHTVPCFVISIVDELPYGRVDGEEREIVRRNLEWIAEQGASPVMQQGDSVARTALAVACLFGIRTMFLRRPIAEEMLRLDPPFDVVVVGSE